MLGMPAVNAVAGTSPTAGPSAGPTSPLAGLGTPYKIPLTGTGNTGAALAAYDRIRARLDTDLGIAPGPYLTDAQARILRGTIAHGLRP
jgi:hypothetical protein